MENFPAILSLPLILDADAITPPVCLDGFEGLSAANCATRAEIVHRAHSIWESKGRRDDDGIANWLEAEAEVLARV